MKKAVFPGSFDPVTTGHIDLLKRAALMFDSVVVGVLVNSQKKSLLTLEQRRELLERLTMEFDNVSVDSFDGLLVDFVEKHNACAVIRGLRNAADLEYELPLAQGNQLLNENADTVFLVSRPEHSFISSSAVKELYRYDADITPYVPEEVINYLKENDIRPV